MADNTTEQSLESALAELREMFPKRWINITVVTHSAQALETKVRWSISVNQVVEDFEAPTLSEAMDQVRAWHAEQAKESNR